MKRIGSFVFSALLCASLLACSASSDLHTSENTIPLPAEAERAASALQPIIAPDALPLSGLLNPLTGQAGLDGFVDGQRPIAISIDNDSAGLPLRGIASSDVLIEGLNERGTTSLLALFGDFRTVPQVGPVSSLSDPFLQFALPSNAIPVHIDTSPYAENLLNVLSYQDVNGIYVGTTGFVYDAVRASTAGGNRFNENCWYTDANLIWNAATAVGLNPIGEVRMMFNFAQENLPHGDEAVDVNFSFNEANLSSVHYDENTGLYSKTAFGALQSDESGTVLSFDNVFILFAAVQKKADSPYLDYTLTEGDGYYFQGGRITAIRWQKDGPTGALRLFGADGTELQVQQGKSYLAILPESQRNSLQYVNAEQRAQIRAEAEAAEAAAAEAAAAEAAAAEAAAAEAAAAEAAAA